jgi:TolB-like protein/Flp pilus assembly protein TadD
MAVAVANQNHKGELFVFGSFELDTAALQLRKAGVRVKIAPQQFSLLRLLVGHAGEVVSRNEIQRQIWGEDTHVDFELGLNYCVNRLRAALGDSAEAPQYIETVPRSGYRFVAAVQCRDSSRRMLAVIPFDNLSGDSTQEYLSEGLTEEVITELGRLMPDRLGVIARYSSTICKRKGMSLDQIAATLGVDHVLEGSIRRDRQRVRVSLQLIRATDQTHLWADTYERSSSDPLAMQAELGRKVAEALAIELLPSLHNGRRCSGTLDAEGYDSYLRGRFCWNTWSVESLQEAAACFQRAIDRDAGFASAYSGLADSLSMLGFFNLVRPHEVYPRALRAATRAMELDDRSAEAHASMAWIQCCYTWDWLAAGREFQRATTLNPNYVQAHAWRAFYLTVMDRVEEALDEIRHAKRLDPLSVIVNTDEACFLYFARRYADAVEQCKRTIALNPGFGLPYHKLGLCYMSLGQVQNAIGAFERACTHWQGHPIAVASLACALAVGGEGARARQVLAQLEETARARYVSPLDLAFVHFAMGDLQRAIALLEEAYRERDSRLPFIRVAPGMGNLLRHPRIQELLKQIGLTPVAPYTVSPPQSTTA